MPFGRSVVLGTHTGPLIRPFLQKLRGVPPNGPNGPRETVGPDHVGERLAQEVHPDDAVAGHLFPQGVVAREGRQDRFDNVVGIGWCLVTMAAAPLDLDPAITAWFAALDGRVVVLRPHDGLGDLEVGAVVDEDGTYARWFADHGLVCTLQRPDSQI